MTMADSPTTRERITQLLEKCDGLTVRQISFILNKDVVKKEDMTSNSTIYASLKRNRRFKKQKIVNDSNVRMYSLDRCLPSQSREKIVDWYDFLVDLRLNPYKHPYKDYCEAVNYLIDHSQNENDKQWLKRFLSATKEAEKNLGRGNGQNHNLYNLKQLDGRLFYTANNKKAYYYVYYRDKPVYKATDYKKRLDLADHIALDLGIDITIWFYGDNKLRTVKLIASHCREEYPIRGDWNFGLDRIKEIDYLETDNLGRGVLIFRPKKEGI